MYTYIWRSRVVINEPEFRSFLYNSSIKPTLWVRPCLNLSSISTPAPIYIYIYKEEFPAVPKRHSTKMTSPE